MAHKKNKYIRKIYAFVYVAASDDLSTENGKLSFLTLLKKLELGSRFVFMFADSRQKDDHNQKVISALANGGCHARCEYSVHGSRELEIILEELKKIETPKEAALFFSCINENDIKSDEFELSWKTEMNAWYSESFSKMCQTLQKTLIMLNQSRKKNEGIKKARDKKDNEMKKKLEKTESDPIEDGAGLDMNTLMGPGVKLVPEEAPPDDPEMSDDAVSEGPPAQDAQKKKPVSGATRHETQRAKPKEPDPPASQKSGEKQKEEEEIIDDDFSLSESDLRSLFDTSIQKVKDGDKAALLERYRDARAVFVQILFDVTAQELLCVTNMQSISASAMEAFISLLATADSAEDFTKSWPNISGDICPLSNAKDYISDPKNIKERQMLFAYMKRCATFYSSISQILYGMDILEKNEEWRKKRAQAVKAAKDA